MHKNPAAHSGESATKHHFIFIESWQHFQTLQKYNKRNDWLNATHFIELQGESELILWKVFIRNFSWIKVLQNFKWQQVFC